MDQDADNAFFAPYSQLCYICITSLSLFQILLFFRFSLYLTDITPVNILTSVKLQKNSNEDNSEPKYIMNPAHHNGYSIFRPQVLQASTKTLRPRKYQVILHKIIKSNMIIRSYNMPPFLPGTMQHSQSKNPQPNQTNQTTQDFFSAYAVRESHRKLLKKTS